MKYAWIISLSKFIANITSKYFLKIVPLNTSKLRCWLPFSQNGRPKRNWFLKSTWKVSQSQKPCNSNVIVFLWHHLQGVRVRLKSWLNVLQKLSFGRQQCSGWKNYSIKITVRYSLKLDEKSCLDKYFRSFGDIRTS